MPLLRAATSKLDTVDAAAALIEHNQCGSPLGTITTSPAASEVALPSSKNLAGAAGEQVYAAKAPGPGVAPSTLGSPAAHVLIEPYLPYPLLLSRCRLVVSQGGFGVLLAGLAHGLPQLVIPLGADQYGNAEAVAAGAGLILPPESVTAAAVDGAVVRLRDEPSFVDAARAVQAAIAAMPDAETVLTGLAEASLA